MATLHRCAVRLLDERHNRHAWRIPTILVAVGIGLLLAGLGIDLWWVPALLPLALRPTPRRAKRGK